MFKYKVDAKNHTHSDGKSYRVIDGILTVPFKINAPFARLIVEEKKVESDEKETLIEEALGLKIGAKSSLKRLSVETLKERINEAK